MFILEKSLNAWGTADFNQVLKHELERLDAKYLPLQQALSYSSHAITDHFSVSILAVSDDRDSLRAKVGIFYSGVVAGCNCADDPTPIDEQNEYCEISLLINKSTGQTIISLLD